MAVWFVAYFFGHPVKYRLYLPLKLTRTNELTTEHK